MLLLIVMIIMLVMGIYALATGKIKLSPRRVVEGLPARVIGAVLCLPLPLHFGISFLVALAIASQQRGGAPELPIWTSFVGIGLMILCGLAAVIIGAVTAHRLETPARARPPVEHGD
jgi:hypothetical protein